MNTRPLQEFFEGIVSFVPLVNRYRKGKTGGTVSARYCYSVWLRHLISAKKNGLSPYPRVVAELGPGDSLGIGLAALISGCEKYFALDVVEYASTERNLNVFDELVELFQSKANIPGEDEFPDVKPYLENYSFPAEILDEKTLQRALSKSRLAGIRGAVSNSRQKASCIQYKVPWDDKKVIGTESVDMLYSQAVLEHVDDLSCTYKAMRDWLKPTGFMSHQIDFKCHGTANQWNGHWAHTDFVWKLIRGRRPYLLNRAPHSAHIAIMAKEGFDVIRDSVFRKESQLSADRLAPRFRSLPDEDLVISGAFIQAVLKIDADRSRAHT